LRRGQRAILEKVSLSFEAGTWVAVLGENGAGKTTLLDALAGVRAPNEGTVAVDGQDLHSLSVRDRARRIASMGQHLADDAGLRVEARVAQGLVPRSGPDIPLNAATRARVHAVAEELDLTHHLPGWTHALSGGERRRVQLARTLVDEEAAIVVVDEPLSGLDVRARGRVAGALRSRALRGQLVIMATHDLDLAARHADRIIGLKAGRVAFDLGPQEAFRPENIERIFGVPGRWVEVDGGFAGVVFAEKA
jgi:iron complex transport system ATP-binding protein